MQIVSCQINESFKNQATNIFPLNLCCFVANCALSRITRFLCYFLDQICVRAIFLRFSISVQLHTENAMSGLHTVTHKCTQIHTNTTQVCTIAHSQECKYAHKYTKLHTSIHNCSQYSSHKLYNSLLLFEIIMMSILLSVAHLLFQA